jgi:hypothetical protein
VNTVPTPSRAIMRATSWPPVSVPMGCRLLGWGPEMEGPARLSTSGALGS